KTMAQPPAVKAMALSPEVNAVGMGELKKPTGWTQMVETPNGTLYYNARTGAGAVGRVDSAGNHIIIKSYAAGSFGAWTHIVNTPNGILYHNSKTGAGAVGRIDEAGNHTTIKFFSDGSFATGWTSI